MNYAPHETTPDHSTFSITRKRLPPKVFDEVFQFVLKLADEQRLLSGKTVSVDSTTLEANAAMKSLPRRDTGEDCKQYVVRLIKEEGKIDAQHEPTDEDIRRFDKERKNKEVLNDEWASPVVDLESDLILAAEIRPADHGDAQTLVDSVLKAHENLQQAEIETEIEEIVAAAHNLGRILRRLCGVGTPKSLQGLRALAALVQLVATTLRIMISTVYDRLILSFNRFAAPYSRATTS